MISVDMSSLWADEVDKIVKGITEATNNIISYHNHSKTTKQKLIELLEDVYEICKFWTGNTYVGRPKKDAVRNAFQLFFEELMKLLLIMKDSKKTYERNVSNTLLYRGKIYRYLGSKYKANTKVEPIYDNIYVSWGKEPENHYMLSKLCGNVTWLACEIVVPHYGIDLDRLGCSPANEHEVVFPTIETCITEIKYL